MTYIHERSERIRAWGTFYLILGIVCLLIGLIAVFGGDTWGLGLAITGIGLFVLSTLLKGMAVLVENAEGAIIERKRTHKNYIWNASLRGEQVYMYDSNYNKAIRIAEPKKKYMKNPGGKEFLVLGDNNSVANEIELGGLYISKEEYENF